MRTQIVFALVLLLIVSPLHAGTTTDIASQAPRARPLIPATGLDHLDPSWRKAVAVLLMAPCLEKASAAEDPYRSCGLFTEKEKVPGRYFAILPGPQFAVLWLTQPSQWQLVERWDFTEYTPSEVMESGPARGHEIYPALYPISKTETALAITYGWSESYSGGGALFTLADFVRLNRDGSHRQYISSVPFSCNKWIRACFTEQQYKSGRACSEGFEGQLRLTWSADYLWRATWRESHTPGGVRNPRTTFSKRSVELAPDGDEVLGGKLFRESVSFCDPID